MTDETKKPSNAPLRVGLFGAQCGKSSIIMRFLHDEFICDEGTIEDTHYKKLAVDGEDVDLQILDTGSNDCYTDLQNKWFASVDTFIFVFSVTSKPSFEFAQDYYEQAHKFCVKNKRKLFWILCGTQADQVFRQVNEKEGSDFALAHGGEYLEVSAKTGSRIQELFAKVVRGSREKKEMNIPEVNLGTGKGSLRKKFSLKRRDSGIVRSNSQPTVPGANPPNTDAETDTSESPKNALSPKAELKEGLIKERIRTLSAASPGEMRINGTFSHGTKKREENKHRALSQIWSLPGLSKNKTEKKSGSFPTDKATEEARSRALTDPPNSDTIICKNNSEDTVSDTSEDQSEDEKKSTKSEKIIKPKKASTLRSFLKKDKSEKKAKKNRKKRGTKVFGIPLVDLLEREEVQIPPIITRCVAYIRTKGLGTEGLFRVSPNLAELDKYVKLIDEGKEVNFEENRTDIHIACGLIKKYLRELPPLLTYDLYNVFLAIHSIIEKAQHSTDFSDDVINKKMKVVCDLLPVPNRNLLQYLLEFMDEVAARSAENKMTRQNMCTMFAPILLRSGEQTDSLEFATDSSKLIAILSVLLSNRSKILV